METTLSEQIEDFKSEFRMAKQGRFTPRLQGVDSAGSGADYHYSEYAYLRMIERARHYERNDMVVGQGIRRLVSNVVQQGFTPDPDTGDDNLNAAYKELWQEWAGEPDLCHSEGEFNFHQIERLNLRSTVRDGDIWHLLLANGSIQCVEGHRPRSPMRTTRNVVNGVRLDDDAKRKQVWISKEPLSYFQLAARVSDLEKYDIRDELGHRVVLQVYFPDRFSQRRGISGLAPCSDIIGMHDDLQFTTLVKAQMSSLIVLLREWDKGSSGSGNGPPIGNLQGTQSIVDQSGSIKPIEGVGAGLDVTVPAGQTIKGFSANVPNTEFFDHSYLLLTFLAVNLDLPVQVLLLDPQKSNFSSWRGAIDQARIRYREIQQDLVNQFHRPVWTWKCRGWASNSPALRRMADNNPHWLRHNWKRPSFPYIEPLKDAQADAMQQEKHLSSPRRIAAAKGAEFADLARESVEDKGLLFTLAMEKEAEILKKFPESGVTWRDLLSPAISPIGASTAAPEDEDDEEEDDEEKKTETAKRKGE